MIEFETRGSVAILTFANGRLNILTREMHRALHGHLLRFLRDERLKVGVLTCAAGSSFSAGDDLKTVDAPFGDEPDWEEIVMTMPRGKPIVGATRGHCVGQGLIYLLMLTELRYCAPNAAFGFPEIRAGMGGAGIVSQLSRHIPPAIAMHMLLTGESLDARAAAACHMVNDVVPDDQLLEHALAKAARIASHPMLSLQTELWPGARQGDLGRAEAVALASTLWELQRHSASARAEDGPPANEAATGKPKE